jgi:hypothetical protein
MHHVRMRDLHRKRKMLLIRKFLTQNNNSQCQRKNKERVRESQMLMKSIKRGCMMSQ